MYTKQRHKIAITNNLNDSLVSLVDLCPYVPEFQNTKHPASEWILSCEMGGTQDEG